MTHQLYRNNRDGTFTDISSSSGIATAPPAPGLGVIMTDLDGDGLLDIYVANDLKPAYLFHNRGQSRFEEKGMESGSALGPLARMMSGMGVDAGDVDGTGRPALLVTDFFHNGHVLFRNRGRLVFQDWSQASGLAAASLRRLGFGTVFADVDLDGRLDVAVANGHVYRNAEEVGEAFQQEAQLFLGDGHGRFRDVSAQRAISGSGAWGGGWPGPISTTTAGLTSLSATTAGPSHCCSIAQPTTMPGLALNCTATVARVTATRLVLGSKSKVTTANRSASSTGEAATSRRVSGVC